MKLALWIACLLLVGACSSQSDSSTTAPAPAASPLPAVLSPLRKGNSPDALASVTALVLVSQSFQHSWPWYQDAFSCSHWVKDASGHDLIVFEPTFCSSDGTLPVSVALTLSLTSGSDSSHLEIVGSTGDTVGELTIQNGVAYLQSLCDGTYASHCHLTFDGQGRWNGIDSHGVSLSY